jgi:hypothetical protein
MSGGGGKLDSFVEGEDSDTNVLHDLALPVEWAVVLFKDGASFAPREGTEREREWVVCDLGEPREQWPCIFVGPRSPTHERQRIRCPTNYIRLVLK